MPWAELVGHETARAALRRAVASDRVAPAWLLRGPEGVGRRRVALGFAAALACPRRAVAGEAAGEPCGSCPSCRRVALGTHPDVEVHGREEGRRDLDVAVVEGLQRFLERRPMEATRRVAIVDEAERLNEAAANKLLKTLEEPPGHAVLVLLATRVEGLLPTVRSRCLQLPCRPLSAAQVDLCLARAAMPAQDAAWYAAVSGGSPGRALRLAAARARERRGGLLGAVLDGGARSGPFLEAARPEGASPTEAREAVAEALEEVARFYRDLSAWCAGPDVPRLRPGEEARLAARGPDGGRSLRLASEALAAARAIRANAGEEAVVEALLAVIHEEVAGEP
ncbi:MAG: DNA polymerase III subunit delta' [Planctomycetes bacterium]|nr:DNA polymerase III subunit delta' [Planctomycetota bacterium]